MAQNIDDENESIRREKLSIYLAKDYNSSEDDILDLSKLKDPVVISVPECTAVLYGKKKVNPDYPNWASFLRTTNLTSLDGVLDKASSTGAILLIRAFEKIFLVTFGTSAHILRMNAIERDFGLRVTLNSVDANKLRSLDKASYTHTPLNSRNQSTFDVDIFDLDIDTETELVYALTGSSNIDAFGTHITGRDALVINPRATLDTLHIILKKALEQYHKELPSQFSWVDNVKRVKDAEEIKSLDAALDQIFLDGTQNNNVWLGEPEIVDWETNLGYSFDGKSPKHIVLQISALKDHLASLGASLNCSNLKNQKIHISDNNYRTSKIWFAYRCLYAEIKLGEQQYMLRNGDWYRIKADFLSDIKGYLEKIEVCPYPFPIYNHDNEGAYNKELCSDPLFTLMDKKNIHFGGNQSKIEFCDLIKEQTDFIHVKYYRSSSSLSHLFAQGMVSAETFIMDEKFRSLLNKTLPTKLKLKNPNNRPDPTKYNIVYAIASTKSHIDDLPFFSKITLKNAHKRLSGMGFSVSIAFIGVDPQILIKKKVKPSKAKGKAA